MAYPNDDTTSGESTAPNSTAAAASSSSSSTMMLPQILRRGSTMEVSEKHQEKALRRGSMPEPERKPSLAALPLRLRRRKTTPVTEQVEYDPEAASALSRLFFSLPSEIHTQILTHLSVHDIFALRQTSRTLNSILNYNANVIIRTLLPAALAPTTQFHIVPELYPAPTPTHDLSHLLTMLRRQHQLDREIYNLLAFVQMKIYMTRATTRLFSVSNNRQRLIEAFQRPAWFVGHFLERYRDIVMYEHPTRHAAATVVTNLTSTTTTTSRNCGSCPECRDRAKQIVASYPDADVLPAYHFYQMMVEHLQLATRTPMSAGRMERRLRGWSKVEVSEEMLSIFLILGGVSEVRKVAMMQGSFTSRVAFVLEFVSKVRDVVKNNMEREIGSNNTSGGGIGNGNGNRRQSGYAVVQGERDHEDVKSSRNVMESMGPRFEDLRQEHVTSLPDIMRFFYDIWLDRAQSLAPEGATNLTEPYPWLERVMSGSGLDFRQTRTPDRPLAFGASPV